MENNIVKYKGGGGKIQWIFNIVAFLILGKHGIEIIYHFIEEGFKFKSNYELVGAFFITSMITLIVYGTKNSTFQVEFQEDGFKYKNPIKENFMKYKDVKDLLLIYTMAKGRPRYTLKVIPLGGETLSFSLSSGLMRKDVSKFVEEIEHRTGMYAREQRGNVRTLKF